MTCSGIAPESYDLLALGLEDENSELIRDHLSAQCTECGPNFKRSLARVAWLGCSIPLAMPSRGLRRRIIASVSKRGLWSFVFTNAWIAPVAAGLLISLGIAGGWWLSGLGKKPTPVVRVTPPPAPVTRGPEPIPQPLEVPPAKPRPDLTELQRDLEASQQSASQLQSDLAAARARIAGTESELRARESELSAARQEVQNARARLSTAEADRTRADSAERQLASFRARVEDLTRQVTFLRTALNDQQRELTQRTEVVALLSAPGLRVVDLAPTESGGAASGRALIAGGRRAIIYASNLPALPPGRTYQLWLMRSRGPAIVSGGIFAGGPQQSAVLRVDNPSLLAGLTGLAVTDEPAGGSPLPTGQKRLVATVRG